MPEPAELRLLSSAANANTVQKAMLHFLFVLLFHDIELSIFKSLGSRRSWLTGDESASRQRSSARGSSRYCGKALQRFSFEMYKKILNRFFPYKIKIFIQFVSSFFTGNWPKLSHCQVHGGQMRTEGAQKDGDQTRQKIIQFFLSILYRLHLQSGIFLVCVDFNFQISMYRERAIVIYQIQFIFQVPTIVQ